MPPAGSNLNAATFSRNTGIQEVRVLVNGEHLRCFSGTLVSCCGLDFYKYCHVCGKQKKSSGTVNIILRCINRRDLCRTQQVLLPFYIILVRPQLGTRCVLFLHREIQERHGLEVRATKGEHQESPEVSPCHLGGQARKNGVLGLVNVIRSDMITLLASKRLLQQQEEQMFSLSVMGRMRSRCKLG